MTARNFASPTLPFILREEGGLVDDPQDPGGLTNHGITLETWRTYTRNPRATSAELEALGQDQIAAFYGSLWNLVRGDDLADGVDLILCDHFVNSGTNATKLLQRLVGLAGASVDGWIGCETLAALGKVDAGHLALRMLPAGIQLLQVAAGLHLDGKVGPATMAAMKAHPAATLVCALRDAQDSYYRALPGYAHDGRGWEARLGRRGMLAVTLALPAAPRLQAPIS